MVRAIAVLPELAHPDHSEKAISKCRKSCRPINAVYLSAVTSPIKFDPIGAVNGHSMTQFIGWLPSKSLRERRA
jgi:hypothetical protein